MGEVIQFMNRAAREKESVRPYAPKKHKPRSTPRRQSEGMTPERAEIYLYLFEEIEREAEEQGGDDE